MSLCEHANHCSPLVARRAGEKVFDRLLAESEGWNKFADMAAEEQVTATRRKA
jgi:hypothetical protein